MVHRCASSPSRSSTRVSNLFVIFFSFGLKSHGRVTHSGKQYLQLQPAEMSPSLELPARYAFSRDDLFEEALLRGLSRQKIPLV